MEHNGTALALLSDHTDRKQSLQDLGPQGASQMHTALDPVETPIGKLAPGSRGPGDIDPPHPEGMNPLRRETIVPVWPRLVVIKLDPLTTQYLIEQLDPYDPGQVIVTCTCLAQCRVAAHFASCLDTAGRWRRSQGLECLQQGLHPGDIGAIDPLPSRRIEGDKPRLA
jgi:hypothetical protein